MWNSLSRLPGVRIPLSGENREGAGGDRWALPHVDSQKSRDPFLGFFSESFPPWSPGGDGNMKTNIGKAMVARVLAAAIVAAWVIGAAVVAEEKTSLTVTEGGVGMAVVNRELQGKADSFAEGGTVHFFTKNSVGSAGEGIEHVWIHDGK